MKGLLSCLLLLSLNVQSQQSFLDSINTRHDVISKRGLLVLSGWSIVNIGSGVVGMQTIRGAEQEFHKRNILWGGVNLGISQISYWSLHRKRAKTYSLKETQKRTEIAEKLFLFNTGLDIGYVVFGLYTKERSKRHFGEKADRLKGTGASLIVQGAFLTLFDGTLYLLHNKNGNRLANRWSTLSFSVSGEGLSLRYPL